MRAVKRCHDVKIQHLPEAATPPTHGSPEVAVRVQDSRGSASRDQASGLLVPLYNVRCVSAPLWANDRCRRREALPSGLALGNADSDLVVAGWRVGQIESQMV